MSERDDRHDFDLLHGRWRVRNERLVGRLRGSTTWETFDAAAVVRPILGGTGNLDELSTGHRPGFEGLSLRVFDRDVRLWSIHWADNASAALKPPTVGRFDGDRGGFYGDEVIDGRDVKVHVVWADTGTAHPAWSQSFSTDGGRAWEVNWRMSLTSMGVA